MVPYQDSPCRVASFVKTSDYIDSATASTTSAEEITAAQIAEALMSAVLSVQTLTHALIQELAKHSAKKPTNARTTKALIAAVYSFQQLIQKFTEQSTQDMSSAGTTKALVSAAHFYFELNQEMAKGPAFLFSYKHRLRRLMLALCFVIMVQGWEGDDSESETDDSEIDAKRATHPVEPSAFTKKLLAVARADNDAEETARPQKRIADWLHDTPEIEPNKRIKIQTCSSRGIGEQRHFSSHKMPLHKQIHTPL